MILISSFPNVMTSFYFKRAKLTTLYPLVQFCQNNQLGQKCARCNFGHGSIGLCSEKTGDGDRFWCGDDRCDCTKKTANYGDEESYVASSSIDSATEESPAYGQYADNNNEELNTASDGSSRKEAAGDDSLFFDTKRRYKPETDQK